MFENTKPRIGQELLDVPMGDMIRQMAFAIAEAQIVLDQNSIDVAEMMGGLTTVTDEEGNVTFHDSRVYFGTEDVSRAEAIARHNSTVNIQQKAEIRTLLDTGYSPAMVSVPVGGFTPGSTKLLTTEYIDFQGFYYVGNGTGALDAPASQVSYGDLKIASTNTTTDSTTILKLPRRISMLECGFTPTFYQFVDTIIEVKISIRYTQEGSTNSAVNNNLRSSAARIGFGLGRIKFGRSVQTTQVNASYAQKYSYSAEGSSLLRTKLVPIPAPAVLEQRIQRLMEEEFNNTTPPQTPA
ncbi:hypothetical protein [Fluviicola chungangensis]|uniref:Uncharacterized protein n=1 Tax=Fluviicola chungangensis TaxID=2597671 RepID=A0A556MNI9_9FLAO|nr:hypothetical protein [Fluviicola chungangensis]TSJ41531.1 hypothetical protein FO442_13785 [Fluviicola chungangensis]